MQAAATILMSLGTDPVNAGHIASSQEGDGGISFAQSFDESSAQMSEAQPQAAIGDIPKIDVNPASGALMKNMGAMALLTGSNAKTESGAASRLVSGTDNTKIFLVLANTKVPANALEKSKVKLAEGGAQIAPGHSKSSGPAAIQIGSTDAQAVSHETGTPALDILPEISTQPSADTAEEKAPASQVDAADLASPSTQLHEEQPSIQGQNQDQKQIAAPKDKQDPFSKKMVKGHDGLMRTGNTAKKEKTEKASESFGNRVEAEAKPATGVPAIALPMNGAQCGTTVPQANDAQPSAASMAADPRIALTTGAERKPGKRSAAPDHADANDKMPPISSLDDASGSRTATEAPKPGAFPVIVDDKLNNKSQNSVVAIAVADLAQVGGERVGNKSVYVTIAGPHSTADSMHPQDVRTGVGMLPGSSTIDALPPMDLAHKTLQATPATLEVGVADGSRGWLKIRAEMADGGGVNASLATASPSGQDSLHRELPSLTAYLQSEHIAVNRIIVQPAPAPVSELRTFAGGMNNDRREQPRQSGSQGGENRQNSSSPVLSRVEQNRFSGRNESRGGELFSSSPYLAGGSWLSVRA